MSLQQDNHTYLPQLKRILGALKTLVDGRDRKPSRQSFNSFSQKAQKIAIRTDYTMAILLMPCLASCLLPPPQAEDDTTANFPPRIEIDSLTPHPVSGPVKLNTNCAAYAFRASINDPNPNDRLYWRVFIDYHRDNEPLLTEVRTTDPDPNHIQEGQSIEFNINPLDPRFELGGGTHSTHTVELLVSDRPFYTRGVFPIARTLVDVSGYVDSFVWAVALDDEGTECEQDNYP